jgi:hypothetical protein
MLGLLGCNKIVNRVAAVLGHQWMADVFQIELSKSRGVAALNIAISSNNAQQN